MSQLKVIAIQIILKLLQSIVGARLRNDLQQILNYRRICFAVQALRSCGRHTLIFDAGQRFCGTRTDDSVRILQRPNQQSVAFGARHPRKTSSDRGSDLC